MNKSFTDNIFTERTLLNMQQNKELMSSEDSVILQKIFTLINILDVNKDATPQLNSDPALFNFFERFIPGIINIPRESNKLKQKLYILENHFIPTLRNVNHVGKEISSQGFKTMFIVPLKSEIKENNFLRPEYTKCAIDVAYYPKKYNSKIEIYETPGSYIDPGDRTAEVDNYVPQEKISIDLTYYGLPGISFQVENIEYDPSKPSKGPTFIKIVLNFSDATSLKFENIKSIIFTIDRNQELKGDIIVKFKDQSQLKFNEPNIFKGNNQKNTFITNNYNNPNNRDGEIQSFLFLLAKLLGDLMQIVYVKESALNNNLNQFILFTNDLVVALRCVLLKIPFLLSTSYKKVSTSNCNVLYFYDDITAIQQLTLIIEEKQKMIRGEFSNLDTFIQTQLSSENVYIKSYIKANISGRNRMVVDEVIEKYREYLDPLTSQVVSSIEQLKAKLTSLDKDFDGLIDTLKKFSSETEIPDFDRLVRVISSIKIDSHVKVAVRKDKTVYLFNSNKKLVSVKISPITIASSSSTPSVIVILNGIIDTLNNSQIQDTNNPVKQVILKDVIQNYERQALTIYHDIKRRYDEDERMKKLIAASEKKLQQEEESTPEKNIPIPMQSLTSNQDSDNEDDDVPLSELANRVKAQQEGGFSQDIDITTDIQYIYSIFYSYCNYHGIIITKNPSFRQLIEYIIAKTRVNPLYNFTLDDSTIAEIFNSEKLAINKILEVTPDNDTAINHDIDEENMSSTLTDPDIITQDAMSQITAIIQETQTQTQTQPQTPTQTQTQTQTQAQTQMDISEEQEPVLTSISTPKATKKRSLQIRSPEKENYQQAFIKEQTEPSTTTKSKKRARFRLGEGISKRKSINEKRKTRGRNKIKKTASQKRDKKREKKSKNKHKQENKGKREKTRESKNPTRNPSRKKSKK